MKEGEDDKNPQEDEPDEPIAETVMSPGAGIDAVEPDSRTVLSTSSGNLPVDPDKTVRSHPSVPVTQDGDATVFTPSPRPGSSPSSGALSPITMSSWPSVKGGEVCDLDEFLAQLAFQDGAISEDEASTALNAVSESQAKSVGSYLESRGSCDAATLAALIERANLEFIPGYRIESKIGEGGMGVVYKAWQQSLDRAVALKVVKRAAGADGSFVRRFQREALAGAKVNHPNIVSTFDYGAARGTVYIALEFVEGHSVGQELRLAKRLDEARALSIIHDSVLGLSHAFNAGIIHRDIKPANILVETKVAGDARGAGGARALVADLGLARMGNDMDAEASQLTQFGMVIGTPDYMAPEQATGADLDFRADIYCLGATLYHLVAGRIPFGGRTPVEVCKNKLTQRAPDPRSHNEDLSPGLIRLIDRMMAREPEGRHQSYEELLADIEAVQAGGLPPSPAVPTEDSSLAIEKSIRGRTVANVAANGSKRWMIAVAAALLIAVIVAVVAPGFLGDAEGEGSGIDHEQLLSDFAALDSGERIRRAVDERSKLESAIEELSAAKQKVARGTYAAQLRPDLDGKVSSWTTELSRLHARPDYDALDRRGREISELYRVADTSPPAELQRLIEFGVAARDGAGSRAVSAWTAIGEAATPEQRKPLLESFAREFSFSARQGEAAKLLEATSVVVDARASSDEDRRETLIEGFATRFPDSPDLALVAAMQKSLASSPSRLEAKITAMRELRGLDLVSTLASRRESFLGGLADSPGAEQQRWTRRFDEGARAALGAQAKACETELSTLWAERSWLAMGEKAEACGAACELVGMTFPPKLSELLRHARSALEGDAADRERKAWSEARTKSDASERIEALASFATSFPFSPSLKEAESLRLKTEREFPALDLVLIPAEAEAEIDGVASAAGALRLAKGGHRISANAEGYLPRQHSFDHQEDGRLVLRLFPVPKGHLAPKDHFTHLSLIRGRIYSRWSRPLGASMAPNRDLAAMEIDTAKSKWAASKYDLGEELKHSMFRDSEGFRLEVKLERMGGAIEMRFFEDENKAAVVGIDGDGVYIGIRQTDSDAFELLKREPLPGDSAKISVDWDGDILDFSLGYRAAARRLATLRPDWRFAPRRIDAAVRAGKGRFYEPGLYPLFRR